MSNPDVRWRQRLQSFRKAFARLSGAAALSRQRELTDLERQGLIQSFEFTFELGWNVLKDYLESIGFSELRGPKPVVRKAFANDVIEEGEEWIAMIESRNRTSHTYNEETAAEIATAILTRYVPAFDAFLRRFTAFESEES
jgi:nucleotidyltransferase substrate binding protein (TIGR01987 family)